MTTDATDVISEMEGRCNCTSEEGGDLKDADEVRNQITFENSLHNAVFVKRYGGFVGTDYPISDVKVAVKKESCGDW